jgi:outer membrane protein TolC
MNRMTSDPQTRWRLSATLAAVAALAVLGGCASFSPDGALGPVAQTTQTRLGQSVQWPRSETDRLAVAQRVSELLARPLAADDAVQVALLNNRGLRASFAELGITEAEVVQAGRLPNPGFSFARLKRGDEVELERGFHFNVARLIAMPLIQQLEARRLARVQADTTLAVLALAADTRKAYIQALAAEETVRYMQQVRQTAEASAELARRMQQVGNFNKLQRAREQAFYADAALNLARAEQVRRSTRERLTRLMGLWGPQTAFELPARLPDLPARPEDRPDIEAVALAQRLDVQGARLAAEQTARNLGLTKATRFVNVLELGVVHNSSNEAPTQRGWEIGVELPLFDWGDARVARAEAVYMQAVDRAAETAINARSEVREAYAAYRSAYDIAEHQRDELVPLRKLIAEENLLRYNGMLIGVFELLADARLQIASVNRYIESLRDFWIAQADLELALIGQPRLAAAAGPSMNAADTGGAGH